MTFLWILCMYRSVLNVSIQSNQRFEKVGRIGLVVRGMSGFIILFKSELTLVWLETEMTPASRAERSE